MSTVRVHLERGVTRWRRSLGAIGFRSLDLLAAGRRRRRNVCRLCCGDARGGRSQAEALSNGRRRASAVVVPQSGEHGTRTHNLRVHRARVRCVPALVGCSIRVGAHSAVQRVIRAEIDRQSDTAIVAIEGPPSEEGSPRESLPCRAHHRNLERPRGACVGRALADGHAARPGAASACDALNHARNQRASRGRAARWAW